MRGTAWIGFVLVITGCALHQEASVKHVALAELEGETADLVYFNFIGSDEDFDYFRTPDGGELKLSAAESKIPHQALPPQLRLQMPPGSGMTLFVKLKGGQWVPPDPEQMRKLFPEDDDGPAM
jgi:hypothetical protein